MRRRDRDERTHLGQSTFTAADRRFDELGRDEVPPNLTTGLQALGSEAFKTLATNGSGWSDLRRHGATLTENVRRGRRFLARTVQRQTCPAECVHQL